jgi:hypothetical protein
MSSERDLLYLTHIAETIELVRSAGPSSREALETDPMQAFFYVTDVGSTTLHSSMLSNSKHS